MSLGGKAKSAIADFIVDESQRRDHEVIPPAPLYAIKGSATAGPFAFSQKRAKLVSVSLGGKAKSATADFIVDESQRRVHEVIPPAPLYAIKGSATAGPFAFSQKRAKLVSVSLGGKAKSATADFIVDESQRRVHEVIPPAPLYTIKGSATAGPFAFSQKRAKLVSVSLGGKAKSATADFIVDESQRRVHEVIPPAPLYTIKGSATAGPFAFSQKRAKLVSVSLGGKAKSTIADFIVDESQRRVHEVIPPAPLYVIKGSATAGPFAFSQKRAKLVSVR